MRAESAEEIFTDLKSDKVTKYGGNVNSIKKAKIVPTYS